MNFEYQLRFVIFDEKPGARKEQHWETTYEQVIPSPPPIQNIRHNGKGGMIMPVRDALAKHELGIGAILLFASPGIGGVLLASIIKYVGTAVHYFH